MGIADKLSQALYDVLEMTSGCSEPVDTYDPYQQPQEVIRRWCGYLCPIPQVVQELRNI